MMVLVLWIVMAWRLGFYRVEGRIRVWNSIINAQLKVRCWRAAVIVIVTFFSRQLGTGVSRSFFMIFRASQLSCQLRLGAVRKRTRCHAG